MNKTRIVAVNIKRYFDHPRIAKFLKVNAQSSTKRSAEAVYPDDEYRDRKMIAAFFLQLYIYVKENCNSNTESTPKTLVPLIFNVLTPTPPAK